MYQNQIPSCVILFLVLLFPNTKAQTPYSPKIMPDRLAFIDSILNVALAKNDTRQLAEAWYLYGKTYAGIGNYKDSRIYFLKSLEIQERLGDSFELGRLYLRLSDTELTLGHYRQTLRYAGLAKNVFTRIHSNKGLLSYYAMLSLIRTKRWEQDSIKSPAKFDSLMVINKMVYSIAMKQKDSLMMAGLDLRIGNLLVQKDPAAAIEHINNAVQLYSRKNQTGHANSLIALVPAYINIGQYASAFKALKKADDFYQKKNINDLDPQIAILKNYVLYFSATGNWQRAFQYLYKLNELEKMSIIADRNGAISRLSLDFENEKKEKLLLAQRQELTLRNDHLQTQQYFSWTLAALLVTAMGAGVVFFRLYLKNQQTSHWNAELLQEQNHRVKNNLQIISSLLNMQSKRMPEEIAKTAFNETRLRIESMSILHRRLYDGEKFAAANLDEFIQEVVDGVLKSYGFDHLKPDYDIIPYMLTADKAVRLGLILNELSTNACKYAFPMTEEPIFTVHVFAIQNKLKVVVRDNGPGMKEPVLTPNSKSQNNGKAPFGLSLIQTQVVQLNGVSQFSSVDDFGRAGTEFNLEFKV